MIFNSLGSNYDFKFAIQSLFAVGNQRSTNDLKRFLSNKYAGEVALLYKGREALKLALDFLNLPKGSLVGITGFTCYAVYQAVVDAGYKPEYLDIDKSSLNFSTETLKPKIINLKVLIVQNTLGNPCDIEGIKSLSDKNGVVLIEDLAHCVGTKYKSGQEAGTVGDFAALSFSQDKMIDAISGGVLIVRNKRYRGLIKTVKYENLSLKTQIKDRIYPLLTFIVRKTYCLGIGKALHFAIRNLNLLSQPVSARETVNFHKLPTWYCRLAQSRIIQLNKVVKHRRKIASIYAKGINPRFLSENIVQNLPRSSNIRIPIFVKKRQSLISYLKKFGIHVSDIWYDAPISPSKYLTLTDYRGQCPVSEKISKIILNLPTHINVTAKEADKISEKINLWLKSA